MKKKLNVGCGDLKFEDCLNIDINKDCNPDLVWDCNRIPYPFINGWFDEIISIHSLEHLNNPTEVLNEWKRILKDDGIIRLRLPHCSCAIGHTPEHKTSWNYHSWILEDRGFKVKKIKLSFLREHPIINKFVNPFLNIAPRYYERFLCWIFPCAEIVIELQKKIKEQKEQ